MTIQVKYTGITLVTIDDDQYEKLAHSPATDVWSFIETEITNQKVVPLSIAATKWNDA